MKNFQRLIIELVIAFAAGVFTTLAPLSQDGVQQNEIFAALAAGFVAAGALMRKKPEVTKPNAG